jgi:DnaJ-class molecular chaperone
MKNEPKKIKCTDCNGTGKKAGEKCKKCNGTGKINVSARASTFFSLIIRDQYTVAVIC